MLGSRLVLEDSFILGKPKFLASEREIESPVATGADWEV